MQAGAEHSRVGDGDRADLPEAERVGILLRANDGVLDGPGADLALQLRPSFRRERPLDMGNPKPVGVHDMLADPA